MPRVDCEIFSYGEFVARKRLNVRQTRVALDIFEALLSHYCPCMNSHSYNDAKRNIPNLQNAAVWYKNYNIYSYICLYCKNAPRMVVIIIFFLRKMQFFKAM